MQHNRPIPIIYAKNTHCRGRFIVPAYTYTPTKWQTEMRVRWCGNVYLIMWKHVIDNVDMRVRWNGNTYLMTWIHVFGTVRIRARWIGPYSGCTWTNIIYSWCKHWLRINNRSIHSVGVGDRFIAPVHTELCNCTHVFKTILTSYGTCKHLL